MHWSKVKSTARIIHGLPQLFGWFLPQILGGDQQPHRNHGDMVDVRDEIITSGDVFGRLDKYTNHMGMVLSS